MRLRIQTLRYFAVLALPMNYVSSEKIKLRNGTEVPVLGFGTFKISNEDVYQIVLDALNVGYRHIDTAAYYGNEEGIGRAIRDSGIPPEDIFVTSKVWYSEDGYDETIKAFEKSESLLGKIDLYLIHWPRGKNRIEMWRALEHLEKEGRIKASGVSNYMERHLEEIERHGMNMPAANQVEFSPFLYKKGLLEYCRSKHIVLEAYSPLTRGTRLNDSVVSEIAQEYNKTPAQILLRWVVQKDMMLIAKTTSKERMKENSDIFNFVISPENMDRLDSLNEDYHTTWNPEEIE